MIAVLGAGPHGRQVAHDLCTTLLFDDDLPGFEPTSVGVRYRWIAGAVWPAVRRQIAERHGTTNLWRHGLYVAPTASTGIEIDVGVHVHILAGAVVSHGCRLGDYVTVATGANVCGEAHIGDGVFVGAGATIVHGGIKVGDGAVIGAGAVVIDDIPPGGTAVGVPARVL